MASIRQRGDAWQAKVTRKGFPPEVCSFSSKSEARRCASEVEAAMQRGQHHANVGTNSQTFRDVLGRYMRPNS
jgi:hypothetical protein